MPALNAGITPPGQGDRNTVWNILGQTYYLKEVCDTSFAFEVVGEPGTFVPAHIHRRKTNSSTSSKARWN